MERNYRRNGRIGLTFLMELRERRSWLECERETREDGERLGRENREDRERPGHSWTCVSKTKSYEDMCHFMTCSLRTPTPP